MGRYEQVEEVFDRETGAVTTTVKKTFTKKIQSDKFYVTFLTGMQNFFKIKGLKDVFVLAKLCTLAEYNTGKVKLTTETRKVICDELEINNPNLSHSLNRLKGLELISGKNADLQVDPRVFWKGNLNERLNVLQSMNITVWFDSEEPDTGRVKRKKLKGPGKGLSKLEQI